ncbi:MAG: type II secretion system ATPase GspE, partial [Pseudomonadales bacterium]
KLPFSFAREHGVLLETVEGKNILRHLPSMSLNSLMEIQRAIGCDFEAVELPEDEFRATLTELYQGSDNEATMAAENLDADLDLSRLAEEIPSTSDLMDSDQDAPVIRLINALLSQAIREQASDIHIETFEEQMVVRFRVDGVLQEVLSPKRALATLLVSRLKVMAKLDIAEKRVPQDGRISVRIAGHAVDIRMSTIPSVHGERVVLRLLDKQAGQLELEQLRMGEGVEANYRKALLHPHGVILVTGPTGSGKTTSLYAGLSHINETSRNILTIEDPIEYMLPGIGQTQVNPKATMTFARGLRAILRQDPDVVMVGEIRDIETAEIAVQASLTGHLVLSTLHTNTAIGAITRMNDMGVEPFLLSSSLVAVMAQRLVRILCLECKEHYQPEASTLKLLGVEVVPAGAMTYRAKGCRSCSQSGYRGRTGIYELIMIDEEMRHMIHDGASEQELHLHARRSSQGIIDHGRERVFAGETSVEELVRVTTAA